MDNKLKSKILQKTGIHVKTIDLVEGGWSTGKKYIINKSDKSDRYMIKLSEDWHKNRDSYDLNKKMNYMKKINEHRNISIYPVHARPLKFDGAIGYVYNYVEGMTLSWHLNQNHQIKPNDLGKFVGKFHNISNKISGQVKVNEVETSFEYWYNKCIIFILQNNSNALEAEILKNILSMFNSIKTSLENIPTQYIYTHGNIHAGNIIIQKNGDWKLIDMDDLKLSLPSRDFFPIFHKSFCQSENWCDLNYRFNDFLLGYLSQVELESNKKNVIVSRLLCSLLFKIYTTIRFSDETLHECFVIFECIKVYHSNNSK